MKIIFDLDGTLICSKKRLHALFCDLVKNDDLSFDEYWNLKFAGHTNQDILKNKFGHSADEIELFVNHWMLNIESNHYLDMDSLIVGADKFLCKMSKENQLYICTARQSITQVKHQLEKIGIAKFFENFFVTEQIKSKKQLLIESGINFTSSDCFVGDTGHDIMTGKELGLTTYAVLSGFMSKAKLELYSPNFIVEDITVLDI